MTKPMTPKSPRSHGRTLTVGIAPEAQVRARMLAIAKGTLKPKPGDPKVWFTSMKSLAEVLSDDNRALLRVIRETQPDSIAKLAAATGRKPGNLSRTLGTMSRYGIVEMQRGTRTVKPIAKADQFHIVAD